MNLSTTAIYKTQKQCNIFLHVMFVDIIGVSLEELKKSKMPFFLKLICKSMRFSKVPPFERFSWTISINQDNNIYSQMEDNTLAKFENPNFSKCGEKKNRT